MLYATTEEYAAVYTDGRTDGRTRCLKLFLFCVRRAQWKKFEFFFFYLAFAVHSGRNLNFFFLFGVRRAQWKKFEFFFLFGVRRAQWKKFEFFFLFGVRRTQWKKFEFFLLFGVRRAQWKKFEFFFFYLAFAVHSGRNLNFFFSIWRSPCTVEEIVVFLYICFVRCIDLSKCLCMVASARYSSTI